MAGRSAGRCSLGAEVVASAGRFALEPAAMAQPERNPRGGMEKRPKVGEILVEAGVIDELQLRAALGEE